MANEGQGSSTRITIANNHMTNMKKPKTNMPKKFDGTNAKFPGCRQQVQLFLYMHPLS